MALAALPRLINLTVGTGLAHELWGSRPEPRAPMWTEEALMYSTAVIADRSVAGSPAGDEHSRGQAIAGREACPADQPSLGVASICPDPVPDPTWDRITQASWESFPASDAPGWR